MKCRRATVEDMESLLLLAQEYISETEDNFTYNRENSTKHLNLYIKDDESDVFIVETDKPCGVALVAFDDEFHDERLGYVSKFYVSKHARGTNCARILAKDIAAWFDSMGCESSYATATANIPSQEGLFKNLLAKFGYEPCGQTLQRKKR